MSTAGANLELAREVRYAPWENFEKENPQNRICRNLGVKF